MQKWIYFFFSNKIFSQIKLTEHTIILYKNDNGIEFLITPEDM